MPLRLLMRSNMSTRSKTACIIAAGNWGGHRSLFKNRDRNYTPKISIIHEVLGDVEVMYLKDEVTGWCEGFNELGVGIVNSALAVALDEKEGKASKGKSTGAAAKDGARVLQALQQREVEDVLTTIQTHLGGLRGHTLVSTKDGLYSLEATWRGHDYHVRKLDPNKNHVRTNHGMKYQDAGYTPDHGDRYLSSLARKDQAMRVVRSIGDTSDVAPTIYGQRKGPVDDPLNMVKLTEDMRTTSQVVFDLKDLVFKLYLIPGQVEYLGYESRLPDGHTPSIRLEVFEYTDLDDDGDFDVVKRRSQKKDASALRVAGRWASSVGRERLGGVPLDITHICSSNEGKVAEYRRLGLTNVKILNCDLPEPNADPIRVIRSKVAQVGANVLVDDVSLDVEGEDVGVNIRWLLQDLPKYLGKHATFNVHAGYQGSDGMVKIFTGFVDGTIVAPRGSGFGFDPYFLPDGASKTLGESKPDEHNPRAHVVRNILTGRPAKTFRESLVWDGPWQKSGTLSESEKEDREAERLLRDSPSDKPPRKDKQRNIVNVQEAEPRDKDTSHNYKDNGG